MFSTTVKVEESCQRPGIFPIMMTVIVTYPLKDFVLVISLCYFPELGFNLLGSCQC